MHVGVNVPNGSDVPNAPVGVPGSNGTGLLEHEGRLLAISVAWNPARPEICDAVLAVTDFASVKSEQRPPSLHAFTLTS